MLSENKIFNLGDFATIEIGEYEYLDNDDQVFQMKGKINILESKKFNRFYLITTKLEFLKKIYILLIVIMQRQK